MAKGKRLPIPPYNPGLWHLVQGKRAWDARTTPAAERAGFRGWHERGYLPHRDSPGLIQFITWHLADAFPAALRSEWSALLRIEQERERRSQLESYLDKGCGAAWLKRSEVAAACEQCIRKFDGERYKLCAWCLMPNHVHILVLVTTTPMSDFVKSWKGGSARECNLLLGRTGKEFWADDFWDTYMRDTEHERNARNYIENNPVKAGLVMHKKDWPWSSARFRGKDERLRL